MQVLGKMLVRDDTTPRRIPIYIANLFFSLHYAAITYVNSSLLGGHYSSELISALFAAGALGNILLFFKAPKIIASIGNRALFIILVVLDIIATVGLGISSTALSVAFFFFIYESAAITIYYALDIFLEAASRDSDTGDIRGIDLTLANLAFLFGPMLVAIYAASGTFTLLYIASALLLVPVLYLGFFSFKTFRDDHTLPLTHNLPYRAWAETRNIKGITLSRLSLEFFFALMTIYVPIYLNTYIGFNWEEIGIMFTIMLLPFVIFQLPAGYLADKKFGEKEMLALGFFVMGMPLLFMPFLSKDFVLWATALFFTRIGASLIEVMSDTYFFKQVDKRDTGMISIYRLMRPLSIVIAAVVGGLAIFISSYLAIFFILAISTIWGMYQGLKIIDTK